MDLECVVNYNNKLFIEFNGIHQRKYLFRISILFPLIFLLLAYMVNEEVFETAFVIAAIIIDPALWVTLKIAVNHELKNQVNPNDLLQKYKFTDEEIIIESNSNVESYNKIIKYTGIVNVIISKNLIILYEDKNSAFVIPKNSFTKGTAIDLINHLRNINKL